MAAKSQAWKDLERTVAERLNGVRLERGDDYSKCQLDVEHPYLSIDCKWRSKMTTWRWYEKLIKDDKKLYPGQNKIPILAMREAGKKTILVTMNLDDFIELTNRKDIYEFIKEKTNAT